VIAILDYGMGNLRSVEKALAHVGHESVRTADHDVVRQAGGVILPGVGAFRKAMEAVRARGFDELLRERIQHGVPILGLCLGMQLLFESSTELGGAEGLGLLEGEVRELETGGLKVPQIGWNTVAWRGESPMADGLPDRTPMYHVHSFAPRPAHVEDVAGTAHYGTEFVTAVNRGNVYGVQFHPEKSGAHGLQLLANFAGLHQAIAA
jgi:imidazole glycerol-phosphate synthase subunit HisH